MFAGSEWLILVIGAFVIGLVVWLLTRFTRDRNAPVSSALVQGAPDQVVRDLVLALSGARNTTLRSDGSGTLTVDWSYIPAWAVFIAIIVFPIGLLALLARATVSGSIVADQELGMTRMRMAGAFSKTSVRAVNAVIESRSAAALGAH